MSRLRAIAIKELRQLRRDRLTAAMMVGIPVVQLMLFGFAINTDVRNIRTVVYDQDRSVESRDLALTLEATGTYELVGDVSSYDQITRAMQRGQAHAAIVVPTGYGKDLTAGRATSVQVVVDAADPQTVSAATSHYAVHYIKAY